jgi:hypothetical protein
VLLVADYTSSIRRAYRFSLPKMLKINHGEPSTLLGRKQGDQTSEVYRRKRKRRFGGGVRRGHQRQARKGACPLKLAYRSEEAHELGRCGLRPPKIHVIGTNRWRRPNAMASPASPRARRRKYVRRCLFAGNPQHHHAVLRYVGGVPIGGNPYGLVGPYVARVYGLAGESVH